MLHKLQIYQDRVIAYAEKIVAEAQKHPYIKMFIEVSTAQVYDPKQKVLNKEKLNLIRKTLAM
jgi:coenzyme F420-reducing hydrogenase alpha subunit